ncbi:SDR family NAD(P)-dependent oxidoreductase [Pseudomonas yamanorum]|uniref:SDR family NAD(P)-dependent oxidoreductase n=1 Tax=Pseudomonas yamanorum TaxID=515393 RepID=UPI0021137266|nr:SDR family oxidoreductase [Pseudomonas yamanorum]
MSRLNGKVAIVIGAGRGIGRATAKLFAKEGAKVAVVSRTAENVAGVVAEIQAAGGTALGIVCDVSDPIQISVAVEKVLVEYGRIDILVNNAFDPSVVFSSVLDLSTEQLQRNLEMGPIAYLRTMQACYPHLKASGEGRVINFASLAGVIGLQGYAPYNMAKEAVRALTRSAAREWGADNITVNNVMPVADTWGLMLVHPRQPTY